MEAKAYIVENKHDYVKKLFFILIEYVDINSILVNLHFSSYGAATIIKFGQKVDNSVGFHRVLPEKCYRLYYNKKA